MRKYIKYSDDDLVAHIMRDDIGAFDEIYYRYWKRLYAMAYKRLNSKAMAEELVQEIFISLWVNRAAVNVKNLAGYLFTAMKYKVISHYQRQLTRSHYVQDQTAIQRDIDHSTEETIFHNDLYNALEREINKLPVRCQEAFRLSRQANLSVKQVAAQMGVSEKTVENQLLKAMKVLRTNLRHFIFSIFLMFF